MLGKPGERHLTSGNEIKRRSPVQELSGRDFVISDIGAVFLKERMPPYILILSILCEGILCRIHHALRLIEADLLHAKISKYAVKSLAIVTKCNRAVMRIVALDQNVTVEAAHLRNREYADTAEGLGRNRKNLALCDVSN